MHTRCTWIPMFRMLLVAAGFACGHGAAGARAQAPGHRVLPILYVPADLTPGAARVRLQLEAVRDVQAWYAERLGGVTFYADPLVVQWSRHSFEELAGSDFQNWWPLPEAEFADDGLQWNASSRIKLLLLAHGAGAWAGADSENGGIPAEAAAGVAANGSLGGLAVVGDSTLGGMLAGVCPRESPVSWRRSETGTAWWCNWNTYRGTIAHELGHTFGIPHPDAFRTGFRCDSLVITNMQCHWAWPADSLLPFEAAHMRSLPFFGRDAGAEWQPAQPASPPAGAVWIDFEQDGTLLRLAGRGRGTAYLWGVTTPSSTEPLHFVAPAGARSFIVEMGFPTGTPAGTTALIELRTTDAAATRHELRFGDPPRTITIPARAGDAIEIRVTIEPSMDPDIHVALAHPRFSFRG